MIVKTKKYALNKDTYLKIGFLTAMKEFWWAWFVPVVIMLIPIFVEGAFWWCFGIALLLSILYLLFWGAQFAGITQLEQYKFIFDKYSYEIDSRQILMKVTDNKGAVMKWEQIKTASKTKDAFLLNISRGQFLYLPFDIFKSENDLRFMESILKRKNLLKEDNKQNTNSQPTTA